MKTDIGKKIFIIHPIKYGTQEDEDFLVGHIELLKKQGNKIYYPRKHTEREETEYEICTRNREAIKNCDEVQIYYSRTSEGSKFDLGMSFMVEKPLSIINLKDVRPNTERELEKFVIKYYGELPLINPVKLYDRMVKRRDEMIRLKVVRYTWKENTDHFLIDLGMAFMAEKPIILKNCGEVQRTEGKSFQNLLLDLDNLYGPFYS